MTDSRISDLSEEELLARIIPLLPVPAATLLGPGDDAALVAAPDGRFVVSTDILVENRHFRRAWSAGYDVGWRAAMQNLADIAAMGARPTALVVSLVLPPNERVDWVIDLARGLAAACELHGAGVVGGDLAAGDSIVIAVTVHGDLAGGNPVLRSGARPGDVLAHAGTLGRSAAGLDLLLASGEGASKTMGAQQGEPWAVPLLDAYLRPDPPIAAGVAARAAGATAMLDVSDGLLRDAGRIARASGVRLDLVDLEQGRPVDYAALRHAAAVLDTDPLCWMLTGGEDHGLLATFPVGVEIPDTFTIIGTVAAVGDDLPPVTVQGRRPNGVGVGWDHFAGGTSALSRRN